MDEPSPAVSFPPGWAPPRQEAGKQLSDHAQGEALFAGGDFLLQQNVILGTDPHQLPQPSGAGTTIQGEAGVLGVWENQAGTGWL